MKSSTKKTSLCSICGTVIGNFTCRGCAKDFCTNHTIEHREALNTKMKEVMLEHSQLKQRLTNITEILGSHLLMEQIDEWEEQSIERIHQVATQSRSQLRHTTDKLKDKITEKLEGLGQKLDKSCMNDAFVETDLDIWTTDLQQLQNELNLPSKISIEKEYDNKSAIQNLLVIETSDEVFQQSIGNINIDSTGKIITHGFWNSYGTVRGRGEYSSGCYRIYFQIAFGKVSLDGLFLGITSKSTPMIANPSEAQSSCGWRIGRCISNDRKYSVRLVGGKCILEPDKRDYEIKIQEGDIFELLINCDRRTIRLKNQREDKASLITINVDQCPFPWQISFSLNNWYHRIRLLTV